MKNLLIVFALLASPAFAQEGWNDDVATVPQDAVQVAESFGANLIEFTDFRTNKREVYASLRDRSKVWNSSGKSTTNAVATKALCIAEMQQGVSDGPVFEEEDWLNKDHSPHCPETVKQRPPDTFSDSHLARFERLEDWQAKTNKTLVDVTESLANIAESLKQLTQKPVQMPQPAEACQCDCDCPTLDQIRAVVREELERVTVTVKTSAGVEKKVELPLLKKGSPAVAQLQPGDRVVAIDGKPVTPFTWQTTKGSGVGYSVPGYEMRTLSRGGQFYGAVRQSTCRVVNGVRVCD